MMTLQTPLRIGTRGSKLALAQAEEVRSHLKDAHGLSDDDVEIVAITTTGDRIRDRPLADIGGKALFTKEVEESLLGGAIDLAVHSMKDMPAVLPEGLTIGALLPREDPRDALVSPLAAGIAGLPQGAVVGSSSVRRQAQLKRLRPDLNIVSIRGNVDTRLAKLDRGDIEAILLACAGLKRLGLAGRITAPIGIDEMLPAIAQGAIGIEIRSRDERLRTLVQVIDHRPTAITVACERAFLSALDGSCRTPIAGHAVLDGDRIRFRGEALTLDGAFSFTVDCHGNPADAVKLGREAGEGVKAKGGSKLTLAG
jgi:hydroxymethylbilane synthase